MGSLKALLEASEMLRFIIINWDRLTGENIPQDGRRGMKFGEWFDI